MRYDEGLSLGTGEPDCGGGLRDGHVAADSPDQLNRHRCDEMALEAGWLRSMRERS